MAYATSRTRSFSALAWAVLSSLVFAQATQSPSDQRRAQGQSNNNAQNSNTQNNQPNRQPTRPRAQDAEDAQTPRTRRSRFLRLLSSNRGRPASRLTKTPPVFGDFFVGNTVRANTGISFVTSELLLAGGSGRLKVSDQNSAMPVDRYFIHYNHFHNAAKVMREPILGGPLAFAGTSNIDRGIIGCERTILDGSASIELRLPFTNSFDFASADFQLDGGNFGNLSLIYKQLLVERETCAISFGLGIETPTGSSVRGFMPLTNVAFELERTTVNLQPFIGIVGAPTDNFFYHGFMQIDTPASGNRVSVTQNGATTQFDLNAQTLFSIDMAAGYWFHRNECGNGLAGMAELHFTSSTSNADFINVPSVASFGMRSENFESTNFTLGLHAQINDTAIRLGAAFPLGEFNDRFFSSEILFSIIKTR